MIRVDRTAIPPPAELSGPNSKGCVETDAAVAFYTAATYDGKSSYTKFQAYKLPGVKLALEQLFHGKCAYCESKYIGTQPMAVEHYRPKGAVVIGGKPKKPGYYWLAADWENLLPSCTDCNSQRGQDIPGEDFQVVGKANQFPLADEARRWKKRDDACLEEPLLLNPCADDPEKHLEFLKSGVVRAALNEHSRRDPKGQATIRVCALHRPGLRSERRDHAKMLAALIQNVKDTAEDLSRAPGDKRLERRMRSRLKTLKSYAAADKKYSGMARQLIDKALKELGIK